MPSSRRPSKWNSMASRICIFTSSLVRPVATQPGNHPLRPACLKILFNVPGAKSSLGLPGTVMTSTSSSMMPTIFFQQLKHFTNFHEAHYIPY